MITKVKYLQETGRALREAAERLEDPQERRLMLTRTCEFLEFMEKVQTMPMVARLSYYRAAFATYNLLRVNHQLGRRVGAFDADVHTAIVKILSKLLVENGVRKD